MVHVYVITHIEHYANEQGLNEEQFVSKLFQ